MSLIIGKWRIQESIHNLQSKPGSYYSSPHSQYIGIIVKSCCLCTETVRAKSRTDSLEFICGNGNSNTCSTDKNSFFTFSALDRTGNLFCINRIIYCLQSVTSIINILYFLFIQVFFDLLFQLKSTVVTS